MRRPGGFNIKDLGCPQGMIGTLRLVSVGARRGTGPVPVDQLPVPVSEPCQLFLFPVRCNGNFELEESNLPKLNVLTLSCPLRLGPLQVALFCKISFFQTCLPQTASVLHLNHHFPLLEFDLLQSFVGIMPVLGPFSFLFGETT